MNPARTYLRSVSADGFRFPDSHIQTSDSAASISWPTCRIVRPRCNRARRSLLCNVVLFISTLYTCLVFVKHHNIIFAYRFANTFAFKDHCKIFIMKTSTKDPIKALRDAIRSSNLSQSDAAFLIGINQVTLSRWLSLKSNPPTKRLVEALRKFNLDPKEYGLSVVDCFYRVVRRRR